MSWHLYSWRDKPQLQSVTYPDQLALNNQIQRLSQLPPLVTFKEIDRLKHLLAQAQQGKAFIVQGGDCAESFKDCNTESITNKVKLLLQMGLLLSLRIKQPVVKIGRIAGQYAKPRSASYETVDGLSLPSYRGDLINGIEFEQAQRQPQPERLLQGYQYASLTMNYIRALTEGDTGELADIENWQLDFIHNSSNRHYTDALQEVSEAQRLLAALNTPVRLAQDNFDLFTSHEALHLDYETALTRQHESGRWYNQSTHFPWIGMRTAQPDSAHIEYIRGIENPIAIKVGPRMSPSWLQALVKKLNPDNEPGKLALIHRFGADKVTQHLPELIQSVQQTGVNVVWLCDPMHGNTATSAHGLKTRRLEHIMQEINASFHIHQNQRSHLAGVHLEMTGDDVTECIGGLVSIAEAGLARNYQTLVDPRLNYQQAIELSLHIGSQLKKQFAQNIDDAIVKGAD